jgi:hypothetical protein
VLYSTAINAVCGLHSAGLQCTRLPLVPSEGAGGAAPGSQDCTATRWSVSEDGLFRPLADTSNSSNSSNNSTSGSTEKDAALATALNWLSCSAHYCCGLQVTPNSSGTLADGRSIAAVAVETSIAAFDGPKDRNTSSSATPGDQVRTLVLGLGLQQRQAFLLDSRRALAVLSYKPCITSPVPA